MDQNEACQVVGIEDQIVASQVVGVEDQNEACQVDGIEDQTEASQVGVEEINEVGNVFTALTDHIEMGRCMHLYLFVCDGPMAPLARER
jgi:hypothetical protein